MLSDQFTCNKHANGKVMLWLPKTGEVVHNTPNLIVQQGATILAKALTNQQPCGITHFYVGYNNTGGFTGSGESVTLGDEVSSFNKDSGAGYGFLRTPLAFPANFTSTDDTYDSNIPNFTAMITTGVNYHTFGATFQNTSAIYAVGLGWSNHIEADWQADLLFSRTLISPVYSYNSAKGLAITWGIEFLSI